MMYEIISSSALTHRNYWIDKIVSLSSNFKNNSILLESELIREFENKGINSLLYHLRLCGNIPECIGHDTSEEKLYSKYTDIILSISFNYLGMSSLVVDERSDSADVEVFTKDYSFVADAKSFRLSRTEKNQKDFKIEAMNNWKRGKPYALVVCPIYQLPNSSSQIYQQAIVRNVCIFTYSHLSLLLTYAVIENTQKAQNLLTKIFKSISKLNPTKSAVDYWSTINKTMLSFSKKILGLWEAEKIASIEAIAVAKEESLNFLAKEREKIMKLSHKEALNELIKVSKIDNKIKTILAVTDNGLLETTGYGNNKLHK